MFITLKEFGKVFGVTRQAILHRVYKGEIPAQKIGGNWITDNKFLLKWESFKHGKHNRIRRKNNGKLQEVTE